MSLLEIDKENLPRHIAVIMDGNGRWAKKRDRGVNMAIGQEEKQLRES